MTLGEKIKQVRLEAALTQEQFAEKLCVSRQAVSKWESNRGMPDVTNLQQLASLFGVSIDFLLKDDTLSSNIIRERVDYDGSAPSGNCQSKYDVVVKAKYPQAQITHIIKMRRLTKRMKLVEFFTVPGIRNLFDYMDDPSWHYLVCVKNKKLLVNVTDEYIESREYTGEIIKGRIAAGEFDYILSRHTL